MLHELPVSTDTAAHTAHAIARKYTGLIMRRPKSMSVGTTPLSIHVVATMLMQMSMGTAGNIWTALRWSPSASERREKLRHTRPSTRLKAVADNRIAGL